MQFQYKIQDYQTEAVQAVVDVFKGQELAINQYSEEFIHDMGRNPDGSLFTPAEMAGALYSDHGVRNLPIVLKDKLLVKTSETEHGLLNNIVEVQKKNHILESSELINKTGKTDKKGKNKDKQVQLGRVLLDVEMETGTGKTYVYIKTMFELNRVYGWKKFIIVVPSIAIREGVKKSFDTMENHFQEQYKKKIRCFIYNSSNLVELDRFATDPGINAMIINMQAFSSSFPGEEKVGKNSTTKRIYTRTDSFGSRRPIDVIAEVNPIIIMDEPQKMGGNATLQSMKEFNPLFVLNYSATHKEHHNTVYVLDALDAYKKKLVKRIEVKGIEAKNTTAQGSYVYVEKIIKYAHKPAEAKLRIEVKHGASHKRESHIFKVGADLSTYSNNLQEYANCRVESIDPVQGTVTIGGNIHVTLQAGESYGDMQEQDIRRLQISETIQSHFAKEHDLFLRKVKCLSLFFIDEVAKYRLYDEEGQEKNGLYGEIFEEEYQEVWKEYAERYKDDAAYLEYLQTTWRDPHAAHRGYFSIDKKTGRSIDGVVKSKENEAAAISAYDLILKNKERLLSFEEPTRFIFSHSALREGWDNPNIFQICTLKESDSTISKRQEVGRGMRLCVDQKGNRQDKKALGDDVQNVNVLTVIAGESYAKFVDDLQKDIEENLYDRPKVATPTMLQTYVKIAGESISADMALEIYDYLRDNEYIDKAKKITDKCREDIKNDQLAELPETLAPLQEEIKKVIECIYDEKAFEEMMRKKPVVVIKDNHIKDENFNKKEFQELWRKINHKYAYSVDFNTEQLIEDAVAAIDKELRISSPIYEIVTLEQNKDMEIHETESYKYGNGLTKKIVDASQLKTCRVAYDLVGRVAKAAMVTRKTAATILSRISKEQFEKYQVNPEEFIAEVGKIIVAKKANLVVESIEYRLTEEEAFPTPDIFLMQKAEIEFAQAVPAKKHISEYVFTDGTADNSVEKQFVKNLELADEVLVYAKLPRSFYIPTPVGKYSPDWAIAFKAGTVKHVYFIAETKGSTDEKDLRPIEHAKIKCAEKLFNVFKCAEDVRYHAVATYDDLLNVMKDI